MGFFVSKRCAGPSLGQNVSCNNQLAKEECGVACRITPSVRGRAAENDLPAFPTPRPQPSTHPPLTQLLPASSEKGSGGQVPDARFSQMRTDFFQRFFFSLSLSLLLVKTGEIVLVKPSADACLLRVSEGQYLLLAADRKVVTRHSVGKRKVMTY